MFTVMKFFKKIFSSQEPLKIELKNADQAFNEHKKEEIKKADAKASEIRDKASQKVEGLKEVLEEISDFQDEKGRKAVNDIAENLVRDRKKVIENFSLTEDPEENLKRLKNFMLDFQDVKRKEAAVLEITSKEKEIGRYMKETQDLIEEFENFIENGYAPVKRNSEINRKITEIDRISEKIEDLEGEKEKIQLKPLKNEISDKRDELQIYRRSEEFSEYEGLKEQLEEKHKEKEKILNEIELAISKMQRGLKKLVYQSENSDLVLENSQIIKDLRDGRTEALLEHPSKVKKSLPQLEQKGEISDVQRKKLETGVKKLNDLSEKKIRIEEIEDEIDSLESRIENHPGPQKLEKLREDLEELEEDLEEEESKREDLNSEIDDLEEQVEKLKLETKEIFRAGFDREINFKA